MDKKLIERLAKEAGIDIHRDTLCRNEGWEKPMQKFASFVAEECAKEAEKQDYEWSCSACSAAKNSAAVIRAKFLPN